MDTPSLLLECSDVELMLSQELLTEVQLENAFALCRQENNLDLAARLLKEAIGLPSTESFAAECELTDFHQAARDGDLFRLQAWIAAGVPINVQYELGDCELDEGGFEAGTALTLALAHGNTECVAFLLAQPDIRLDIVGEQHPDASHLLASLRSSRYVVPFLAIRNSEFAHYLDEYDFDVDVRWGKHGELSCLIEAFDRNDLETMAFALQRGADPQQYREADYQEESIWPEAIEAYLARPSELDLAKIRLLMEHGASILAHVNYDSTSVTQRVWESRNPMLMELFDLEWLQEAFSEIQQQRDWLESQQGSVDLLAKVGHSVSESPIMVDLLPDMHKLGRVRVGGWIKRLALLQSTEGRFYLRLEQHGMPERIEFPLPEPLVRVARETLSLPDFSPLGWGIRLLSEEAIDWWHALDDILGHSFRLSLFDELRYRDGQRELMADTF